MRVCGFSWGSKMCIEVLGLQSSLGLVQALWSMTDLRIRGSRRASQLEKAEDCLTGFGLA